MRAEASGFKLGPYEILALVGTGGMALSYLNSHRTANRYRLS